MTTIDKKFWDAACDEIRAAFANVFGDKAPLIELQYHKDDYADNDITIDGYLSIYLVEAEVSTIGRMISQNHWQLAKVWYDPGSYHQPPDGGIDDVGEPHSSLAACIREAVKLYAEHAIDLYHEQLADQEEVKCLEEMEAELANEY